MQPRLYCMWTVTHVLLFRLCASAHPVFFVCSYHVPCSMFSLYSGSINQNEQNTKKKATKETSSVVCIKGNQTVGEIALIVFPLVCHSPSVHVHHYQIWQKGFVCALCALLEYCEPACYCAWHFLAFQHPLLFHISSTLSQSIAGSQ